MGNRRNWSNWSERVCVGVILSLLCQNTPTRCQSTIRYIIDIIVNFTGSQRNTNKHKVYAKSAKKLQVHHTMMFECNTCCATLLLLVLPLQLYSLKRNLTTDACRTKTNVAHWESAFSVLGNDVAFIISWLGRVEEGPRLYACGTSAQPPSLPTQRPAATESPAAAAAVPLEHRSADPTSFRVYF